MLHGTIVSRLTGWQPTGMNTSRWPRCNARFDHFGILLRSRCSGPRRWMTDIQQAGPPHHKDLDLAVFVTAPRRFASVWSAARFTQTEAVLTFCPSALHQQRPPWQST
jgi:hypothetical protein